MNREDLTLALGDAEQFKIIIPNMITFVQAAKEFPEFEDALFQRLLTTEGEFSRLLSSFWDYSRLYGPEGLMTPTASSYVIQINERIKSSDEDYKRILSDMLAFSTFLQSYCSPDEEEYYWRKFLMVDEFKRLMNAPIELPEGDYHGNMNIGADYITRNNAAFINFLNTTMPNGERLSPENRDTLIQTVLSHNNSFERAVKTVHELIAFIQQAPEYTKKIIEKVLGRPQFFDQIIKDDAGWTAIKPFITIEGIKDASSFKEARALTHKQMIKSEELILNSIFRQQLPGSEHGLGEQIAAQFSGADKLKK